MSTFYLEGPLERGATAELPEAAAHHARVKRLGVGDKIRLTNGTGRVADGTISRMGRASVSVSVEAVHDVAPPAPLALYAPVGDRERMLWLAEKATELAITEWHPVVFQRSRSVSPRGEGEAFAAKVRARMISALEQSGGGWLPTMFREIDVRDAAAVQGAHARFLLDAGGDRLDPSAATGGAAVILGPEGGMEPSERAMLVAGGWRPAALAATILRFETAGIAALAIVRAAQTPFAEGTDG